MAPCAHSKVLHLWFGMTLANHLPIWLCCSFTASFIICMEPRGHRSSQTKKNVGRCRIPVAQSDVGLDQIVYVDHVVKQYALCHMDEGKGLECLRIRDEQEALGTSL